MRHRISLRGCVRPSVRRSVCPSVRPVLFSKVKSTHTRRIMCRVSCLVIHYFIGSFILSSIYSFIHSFIDSSLGLYTSCAQKGDSLKAKPLGHSIFRRASVGKEQRGREMKRSLICSNHRHIHGLSRIKSRDRYIEHGLVSRGNSPSDASCTMSERGAQLCYRVRTSLHNFIRCQKVISVIIGPTFFPSNSTKKRQS